MGELDKTALGEQRDIADAVADEEDDRDRHTVTGMCWDPEGHILVVASSRGLLHLVDVDSSELRLHTLRSVRGGKVLASSDRLEKS